MTADHLDPRRRALRAKSHSSLSDRSGSCTRSKPPSVILDCRTQFVVRRTEYACTTEPFARRGVTGRTCCHPARRHLPLGQPHMPRTSRIRPEDRNGLALKARDPWFNDTWKRTIDLETTARGRPGPRPGCWIAMTKRSLSNVNLHRLKPDHGNINY